MKMADEKMKGEKKKDLCFCEKGILPERDPHTEFRCPECGRVIQPEVMSDEKR